MTIPERRFLQQNSFAEIWLGWHSKQRRQYVADEAVHDRFQSVRSKIALPVPEGEYRFFLKEQPKDESLRLLIAPFCKGGLKPVVIIV